MHQKYRLNPTRVGPRYTFIRKIAKSGEKAIIIVPRCISKEILGKLAMVTIEVIEPETEQHNQNNNLG